MCQPLSARKAGKTPEASRAHSQPSPWSSWLGGCCCCCYWGALEQWAVWPAYTFPSQPNLSGKCVSSLVWPSKWASQVAGSKPYRTVCSLLFPLPGCLFPIAPFPLPNSLSFFWLHLLSPEKLLVPPTSSILYFDQSLGATKQSLR